LTIAANKGITNNTSIFLKIALSMNLPIIAIITKVDLVNSEDLYDLINNFKVILKAEKKGKNPLIAKNSDDIVTFSRNASEGILPIFLVSNKVGTGLDLFINFLNLLPERKKDGFEILNFKPDKLEVDEHQFDILETAVIDKKIIVAGILSKGMIYKGAQCKLGPDAQGNFKLVEILSIHCKKIEVKSVTKGQFCSLCLDPNVTEDMVRLGMVLLSYKSNPSSVTMFEAEIWSIDGSDRTLKYRWQPVLHLSHIRQSAKVKKEIDSKQLELIIPEDNKQSEKQNKENEENIEMEVKAENNLNGKVLDEEFTVYSDKVTKVIFEFMYCPEYVKEGEHLIIYENNYKIYGYVTKLIK
jgi:elongation factor 1-alpha